MITGQVDLMRIDLVRLSRSNKACPIGQRPETELALCFEISFEAAGERKETKYHDLIASGVRAGHNTILITLQMGSCGVPYLPSITKLAHKLAMSQTELSKLLKQTSQAAIIGLVPNLVKQE